MLKAMAAPYVGIKFMPTGGINAKNLEDYLSFDKIICCGGSWLIPSENNRRYYTYSYSQKTGSCMKTGSCFLHTYTSYNKKTPINPNSPPLSQPHRMS